MHGLIIEKGLIFVQNSGIFSRAGVSCYSYLMFDVKMMIDPFSIWRVWLKLYMIVIKLMKFMFYWF